MGIYDELMAAMEPGLTARAVVIGPFVTAVRSEKGCGLATTLPIKGWPHGAPEISAAGGLAGRPLAELAGLINSKLPMESSLAMAAINAGLPAPAGELLETNGADLLKQKAEATNLVVIGHFNFIHEITPLTLSTVVLELNPREGDLPAAAAERVIPGADVVAITGSAFSNRTIEPLLATARGKWVMVIGPTTPLSPILFHHGVNAAAGSLVTDPDLVLRQVQEGAVFRQLKGVRRVVMEKGR